LHESYSLVRTITWAVPILGFLGTVVGITMAIANVTPEQLDTSLSDVTEGLAVAFDTTALALALSLVLVFSLNGIQQIEQSQLAWIESWSLREVAPMLAEPVGSGQVGGALRQAEASAAESLLAESEAAIRRQTELWDHSLEELRQRWITTLERQTTDFQTALAQGLGNSLQDHDQKLETLRSEWLAACNGVTVGLAEQIDRVVESLAGGVGECVAGMDQAATVVGDQLGQLQHLGELLLKVIEREEELAGLEQRMVANLEAVRTSEAFEQTLLSLTAAVHLLTARAGSQAA
ncbi:MAG: MotA/TolQ/ExbB proton channel family protein, partial [Planctomycetaceae bacterium]